MTTKQPVSHWCEKHDILQSELWARFDGNPKFCPYCGVRL